MTNAQDRPFAGRRRVRDEYISLDGSPDDEDAKDPIPRIRTYQRLLLKHVTPVERLDRLSTLDLRMLTMRLECELFRRLLRTTKNAQDRERYEARIKGRLDILTELSLSRDRRRMKGRIQSLQNTLGHSVMSSEELRARSFPELESLEAGLRSDLQNRPANGS
jgi:hypothetical protein